MDAFWIVLVVAMAIGFASLMVSILCIIDAYTPEETHPDLNRIHWPVTPPTSADIERRR